MKHPAGSEGLAVYNLEDGSLLASGDWNGKLVISKASAGQILHTLQAADGMIWQAGFAAGGRLLVTFDAIGTMRLWGIAPD